MILQRSHDRPRLMGTFAMFGLLATMAIAPASLAGDDKVKDHPGYVGGEQFADLVDEDGHLIEVSLDRKLLRLFSGRAMKRRDSVIAEILGDLVAVNAVIGEVKERRSEVEAEIDAIKARIERDDWERFVRIRENGQEYAAYIHAQADDDERIDGLLVIGFQDNGEELLFVNLCGNIDMERIALLGERMGLPGLEDLPSQSEMERRREEEQRKSEADKAEDDLIALDNVE